MFETSADVAVVGLQTRKKEQSRNANDDIIGRDVLGRQRSDTVSVVIVT